jgi:hypothetical protein
VNEDITHEMTNSEGGKVRRKPNKLRNTSERLTKVTNNNEIDTIPAQAWTKDHNQKRHHRPKNLPNESNEEASVPRRYGQEVHAGQTRGDKMCSVSWHRHVDNNFFVQCQKWGHAIANCHAKPKCLKCTGEHLTRECQLESTNTPQCANCGGEHTANNIECPTYQKKLEAAQEQRNKNTTKNEKSSRRHCKKKPFGKE